MIAPVARKVRNLDEVPVLQLAQAGADVRARHLQHRGDLLRVHRPAEVEQQRVHLRDGAADAPARAHLAPVQDETRPQGPHRPGQGVRG